MEWEGELLLVLGRPVASVRLSGERWIAFVHARDGAKILGWHGQRSDAQLEAERAARARLALEVVA